MKIAYSSEDPRLLERVGEYLGRYYSGHHIEAEICLFSDSEILMESLRTTVYSLIILHMDYLTGDSGVNLSYRIRRIQPNVPVVLMRFTESGRIECIFINPTVFVMENLSEQSFMPLLNAIRGILYAKPERTLQVSTVQNLNRIVPLLEIIYAESMKHRVYLHLTTGETLELPGPIKTLADKLSLHPEFLFPHRSFIVNAFYISCITSTDLYLRMPAVTIPIARGKLCTVKQAYDSYFQAFGREMNLQVNPASQTQE